MCGQEGLCGAQHRNSGGRSTGTVGDRRESDDCGGLFSESQELASACTFCGRGLEF